MTQVIFKNGSIGQPNKVVKEFKCHTEAKSYAARMRKTLTRGEREYYKMSYVVKVKKVS